MRQPSGHFGPFPRRALVLTIESRRVGTGGEQQLHHRQIAIPGGAVEGRLPGPVLCPRLGIGALF